MKKIYLVHNWGGNINDGWYPWLKNELKNSKIEVVMENMPNTEEPKINEWVAKLDSMVDELNEDVFFVGHSIGCQTILRYLESKQITKIGGMLLVAPWLDLLPDEMDEESNNVAYEWINTSIDFEKVKKFTDNINCIFSDNDYFVSLYQIVQFKEKLNAKISVVKEKGHISVEDSIFELPEILTEAGKMLGLELVEVVDENENFTGKIVDKDIVHDNNWLHKEVGAYVINSKGQLLIQKRSANKRFSPNKWGLCAGHVDAYEASDNAIIRELKEEIGVDVNKEDMKFFYTIFKKGKTNSNIMRIYYVVLDKEEREFTIQEEELSEVKWIDFYEFKQMVINGDQTITITNAPDNINILELLEKVIIGDKNEKL